MKLVGHKDVERITFSVYAKSAELGNLIRSASESAVERGRHFSPVIFETMGEAIDYLNYGQSSSRLFLVEYDPEEQIALRESLQKVQNDPWSHGTVIILIGEQIPQKSEADLIESGVLDFINPKELDSKLPLVLNIIHANSELFERSQFLPELAIRKKGRIELGNDLRLVPRLCQTLTSFCYATGFRNVDVFSRISICLYELITNAIEHGNCGIGYELKTKLINENISLIDYVKEVAAKPENRHKKVTVHYWISRKRALFRIRDAGIGFDLSEVPEADLSENLQNVHGRGIRITRSFADSIWYQNDGSEASLYFKNIHVSQAREAELQKLTKEVPILLKKGEILFEDQSESDYFYYIMSGELGIYVDDRLVAISNPEDIFVGEMAFLLNNKRTGTVKARRDTKLLPISREGFIKMVKAHPYSGAFLARLMTKRLAEKNREVQIIDPVTDKV